MHNKEKANGDVSTFAGGRNGELTGIHMQWGFMCGKSKEIMEYEMVILEEYQFPGYGSRCRKSENSEKLRGPQGVP